MRQLYYFNLPPEKGLTDIRKIAPLIDILWMTAGEEREADAQTILNINPLVKIWLYMLTNSAHLYYPNMPNRNQIMWNKGEAADAIERHPGLPLFYKGTTDMVLKRDEQDYVMIDTREPYWRELMTDRIAFLKARFKDYSGLAYDDGGVQQRAYENGEFESEQFPTRAAFMKAMQDWMTYSRDYVAAAAGLKFALNLQAPRKLFPDFQSTADIVIKDVGFGKGAIAIEFAQLNWKGEPDADNWLNTYHKTKHVIERGGQVWHTYQINPDQLTNKESTRYRQFMTALYSSKLHGTPDDIGVRVAGEYKWFVHFPEIKEVETILGPAKGLSQDMGGGIFQRDFQNYRVRVNSSDLTHELKAPPIVIDDPPVEPPVEPPTEPPVPDAPAIKVTLKGVTLTVDELTIEPAGFGELLLQLIAGLGIKLTG